MKQRDAVFEAIKSILSDEDMVGAVTLTKDQREQVVANIISGLQSGSIDLSDKAQGKYNNDLAQIKSYAVGLVNNWLRKDPRLNGGTKPEVKNPGSRTGQGDAQLKALKILRNQLVKSGESEKLEDVDLAINERLLEIKQVKATSKPKKAPTVKEIDMSQVPNDLKEMLGIAS